MKGIPMLSYPVLQPWRPAPRMAQAPKVPSFITTTDFGGFVTQAKSSVKIIADIAKEYDLTDEERRTIETEVGKISGYTIPMAAPEEGPGWLMVAAALFAGGVVGATLL